MAARRTVRNRRGVYKGRRALGSTSGVRPQTRVIQGHGGSEGYLWPNPARPRGPGRTCRSDQGPVSPQSIPTRSARARRGRARRFQQTTATSQKYAKAMLNSVLQPGELPTSTQRQPRKIWRISRSTGVATLFFDIRQLAGQHCWPSGRRARRPAGEASRSIQLASRASRLTQARHRNTRRSPPPAVAASFADAKKDQ